MTKKKLVVQVLNATDLMPKDGHGSANPYVEVDFHNQRQKTPTQQRDLNPCWNHTLTFNLPPNPADFPEKTVDVFVYNDGGGGGGGGGAGPHRNFLGRARISAACVPAAEQEAAVQTYPLDKRGLFSHIKGEISLRMYLADAAATTTDGDDDNSEGDDECCAGAVEQGTTMEIDSNNDNNNASTGGQKRKKSSNSNSSAMEYLMGKISSVSNGISREHNQAAKEEEEEKENDKIHHHNNNNKSKQNKKNKNSNSNKDNSSSSNSKEEVRTFHSIPAPAAAAKNHSSGHSTTTEYHQHAASVPAFQTTTTTTRMDLMRPAPPGPMLMQMPPPKKPDYELVETKPPLAARMGYRGGDKLGSTYDLVEQMHYLYVSVVKARDLPDMDITGSLDPYVEVKLGNYKGVTRHFEKTSHPIWNQIFAFSKERLQSNILEVSVKDKDVGKDDFVGRVVFDLTEVPLRVPPDSPLAPQWYKLEDRRGMKGIRGEIMLAVWIGTQGDEAFPEAWHSDAHAVNHRNLANTRSKVYFSPKLYYLRVHVIEAQDLIPSDRGRPMETFVKIQLGNQLRMTRPSAVRTMNPVWNEELMFVASEPFDEFVVISAENRVGPGKDEVLGRMIVPVREVPQRFDVHKSPDARWFNLMRPSVVTEEVDEKGMMMRKEMKFSSKIHLRMTLDSGYHVLDETTHYSSDLQPSSKHLRKPSIGILELGILSARNLLPMKGSHGRLTDPYCVAKYGNKWVRTRTLLDTLGPKWNEQYTWEVHDPCTVITIGVFDNCQLMMNTNGNGNENAVRDQRIGKVRIRLSTLEIDKIYTHYYPLLVLQPSGLKKHGELQLALRFTCTAWVNMVAQYSKPLLPKMHYVQPIPVRHIDWLRHQAIQIVGARLARAEPPLRREVVEYMLDVDYNMWSLRRSKANFLRIMSLLSFFSAACRWFSDVCSWRNPLTTCLVHILFLILAFYPELILPTFFLYLSAIGLWNYRCRQRTPPHMDARLSQAETSHPDELDEEFDPFPSMRPNDLVRMRYDRLRSIAGRVQTVAGDLATQGERAQAVLGWRDPRATAIFVFFAVVWAVVLYVTPFQVIAILAGIYMMRHPRFRGRMPPVPVNFFKRLPSKADMML